MKDRLSVPYVPPALQYLSLEDVVKRVPNFGYQLYFASDEATREIEGALPRFMRLMYGRVRPRKPFTAKGNLREFIVSGEEGTPTSKVLLDDKVSGARFVCARVRASVALRKSSTTPRSSRACTARYRTTARRRSGSKRSTVTDSLRFPRS